MQNAIRDNLTAELLQRTKPLEDNHLFLYTWKERRYDTGREYESYLTHAVHFSMV